MFGIAFDLDYKAADRLHPKGSRQAYKDLEVTLRRFGFGRVQQSFFIAETDDLSILTRAANALKGLAWFPEVVRDVRAFRMENRSDFTAFMKEPAR